MKTYYLVSLLAVMPMMAQEKLLTFGIKGGVPVQIPLGQTDNRIPFVIGPTVNVRFFSQLSLESGVLFYRMGEQNNLAAFLYPENTLTLLNSTVIGRAVELPFVAKYHFFGERHTWRPFVTAGPVVRRTSLTNKYTSSILSSAPSDPSARPNFLNGKMVKWNVDPAVSIGVDFKAGRVHLEPEARYSYWAAGVNSAVRKNQVSVLFGFRF